MKTELLKWLIGVAGPRLVVVVMLLAVGVLVDQHVLTAGVGEQLRACLRVVDSASESSLSTRSSPLSAARPTS